MSWYLFKDSPARQLRGKKVDGYQNMQKTKVILDWGLGQLSPKKRQLDDFSNQQNKINVKSLHEKNHTKPIRNQKVKAIEQTIKILTQSSDEEDKQQLLRVLKNYSKKHQKNENHQKRDLSKDQILAKIYNNKSQNVLTSFNFQSQKGNNRSNKGIDNQAAKRMRFLENSLLPQNKQDNVTPVLDFNLNQQLTNSMTDSRLSGKSHFGNKKNQSLVQFGNGYNEFVPIREKVKDMNQKLKQMYAYDEWCRKRELSQVSFG